MNSSIYRRYLIVVIVILVSNAVKSQKYSIYYDFNSNKYHLQNIEEGNIDSVQFDHIHWRDEFYLLKKEDKYGLLDKNGDSIFSLNSNRISIFDSYIYNQKYAGKYDLKYYIYNKSLKLIDSSYTAPVFFEKYFVIGENGKKGVIDALGKLVLPFEFEYITIYINSRLNYRFLCEKYSEMGLLDEDANEIIPFSNHDLSIFNRNKNEYLKPAEYYKSKYIAFSNSPLTKFGVYDENGKLVIPPEYENGYFFVRNGLFCVQKNKKYGFVNAKNRKVVPFMYDEALPFMNNVASVKLNSKYSFIDKKNNLIIPFDNYSTHFNFINRISIYSRNHSKLGMIDTSGNIIISSKYDKIEFVYLSQYYRVYLKKKVGVIDYFGKEIIEPQYDMVTAFKEAGIKSTHSPNAFYLVRLDNKFGVVDSKGEIVLDIKYERLHKKEGLIVFRKDSLYGLMDYDFKIILPAEYLNIRVNSSEWISVLDKNRNNYTINKYGQKLHNN